MRLIPRKLNLLCSGLIVLGTFLGCGDDDDDNQNNTGFDASIPLPPDAGYDAGYDAGRDAGLDAGYEDAGRDASMDAGGDAEAGAITDAGPDAEAGSSEAGTDAGESDASLLSDSEIAGAVSAANSAEIEQANAALSKVVDPDIKDFAELMIESHTDMEKRTQAVLKSEHIKPKDSDTSDAVQNASDAIVASIENASSSQVDKVYIDSQVLVHQQMLKAIDDMLLPSVQNQKLKTDLMTSRKEVQSHLKMARDLAKAL